MSEGTAAPAAPRGVAEKLRVLLELVKFEHSVFALPYAFIGALYGAAWVTKTALVGDVFVDGVLVGPTRINPWLWRGWPDWRAVVWIAVAMVGARSFAFVLNRAIDRDIDARNPRTAGRAVPAGLIDAAGLWVFAAIMLAAYLFACWQLAPICRVLFPVPLAMFLVYPYTKRFTWLCHFWLGACLGLAPVAGWVAVGGWLGHPGPWLIGVAVMLWTAGFDILYATQDVECDRRDGVHSVPADLGVARGLIITRVCHALTVVLLAAGGLMMGIASPRPLVGWAWYAGVAVAAALLVYENAIVRADDLSRVNAAFFTVNGVIAIVVGLGALADRWMYLAS